MDAYRDTHGHFVSKDDNGEQCPHNDGKFMNGLRKGLEGKTVEAHGAELKAGGDNSISDVTMDFKKTADDLVGSTDTSRYDRNFESRAKAKLKEMFDGKSHGPNDFNSFTMVGYDYRGYQFKLLKFPVMIDGKNENISIYYYPKEGVFEGSLSSDDYGWAGRRIEANTIEELTTGLEKRARERDARHQEEAERKAQRERELTEMDKQTDKWLTASDDEILEHFSLKDLTKGTRVGGYIGQSRSKSAEASEAQGSKPMSKWTREDLMDELLQEESLEPFQKKFEGLSFAALKRVALYQDGWHHVGKFATPTDFYAVNSPAEIVMNLKKERNRNKKLRKGLEKGFADGTEH